MLVNNYSNKVRQYRHELILFFLTILACAIIFSIPYVVKEANPWPVQTPAYTLATNLIEHGVYSEGNAETGILEPHSTYTPLYSIIITPLVDWPPAIFILNWLFRGLLVIFLYRLALYFGARKKVAFWGSLIFAIEPYQIVLANSAQSETFLALIIIFFVFSLFRYYKNPNIRGALIMGILLGLSTLVRPVTEFLIIVPLFFASIAQGLALKKKLVHGLLIIATFVLIMSPWLLRNHSIYGIWSLSSLPAHQMLNANIPFFLEWKENGGNASEGSIIDRIAEVKKEASLIIGKDITGNGTVDIAEAKPIMKYLVWPFIEKNWPDLIVFYLSQFPFQMLTDNWRTALQFMTSWPQHAVTPISAAHAAVKGDFKQLLATFNSFDSYFLAFTLGKIYWLIAYTFALLGAIILWIRNEHRILALSLLLFIVYFPFLSLPYLEARYRFPGTPYVFAFAIIGVSWLFDRLFGSTPSTSIKS